MEGPERDESIDHIPVRVLEMQMLLFRFCCSGADWERVQLEGSHNVSRTSTGGGGVLFIGMTCFDYHGFRSRL